MRARRAGEKGVLYVEPDQDELDRRQEKRTMSYEERHQTAPIPLNTIYGHLKKGPCKQTGFKPRVIVYETSSEEEVEQQKPDENNWTALVEKEPKIEAKAPEELKEIPVIQKTDKNRDKELPELTKKIPKDSLSTSKPDEAHSVINTESPKSVAEAKEPEIKLSQQPTSPGTDKIKDPKTKSSSEAASFQSKSDDANSIIKTWGGHLVWGLWGFLWCGGGAPPHPTPQAMIRVWGSVWGSVFVGVNVGVQEDFDTF
jgi:hypothetical protein